MENLFNRKKNNLLMTKKNIYFLLSIDRSYILQASVTIVSVVENINKNVSPIFYIFCYKFNNKPIVFRQIEKKYSCSIICIFVDKYENDFKEQNPKTFNLSYISISTYFRLLMFKINEIKCDRIIYLDADIIVNCDISKLYFAFPDQKLLGAVAEVCAIKNRSVVLAHLNGMPEFSNLLKNINDAPYFNAGFFIANLKLCRKMNIYNHIRCFMDKYPNPKYADQDVLNAVFGQKFKRYMHIFDPCYNVFCSEKSIDYISDYYYKNNVIKEAFANPKILHYTGPDKPWINNLIPNYYSIWWKYANLNEFTYLKQKKSFYNLYLLFGFIPIFIRKIKNK